MKVQSVTVNDFGDGEAAKLVDFVDNGDYAPDTKTEDPKPKRRGRGKAKDASADEAPAEEPKKRGRRAKKDKGITDADLTKAASEAAEVITPDVVKEIAKDDFEVENLADITQERRQEFLDALQAEVDAPAE